MENNHGSCFSQVHFQSLHPDPNISGFTFNKGHPNICQAYKNPLSLEDLSSRTLPLLYQSKANEPNNSTNWFNPMPHHRQAFAPDINASYRDLGQQKSPTTGTSPSPKKFLVFDQSGGKTTLMVTSGLQNPVHCNTYEVPSYPMPYSLSTNEDPEDNLYPLRPLVDGGNIEEEDDKSKDTSEDEMHEDTEELNALLFSDSDDYSEENDDEASTGHSPSTMTNDHVHDSSEEAGEEVDSSAKRQKLFNGDYHTISTLNCHVTCSLKTYPCSALEDDDAEPSCGDGNKNQNTRESGSVSCGIKRSRKEKLHETVSILQSIIPGSNGKDALVVIDEAIHYLKSLKAKAKALGLDAL